MRRIHPALLPTLAAVSFATTCCPAAHPPPATAPRVTGATAPSARAPETAGIDETRARADVPAEYRWDPSPLFADDAAFAEGLAEAARKRAELGQCSGAAAAPARLRACLEKYFATRLLTNRLTLYASMERATDVESSAVQARVDASQGAMKELMGIAAVFRRELLALDDAAMARAYRTEPRLTEYRPYIDAMRRRRAHVFGADAERVLSQLGDNQWAEIDLNELPSDHERTFQALMAQLPLPTITDEDGRPVELTLANYGKYRASPDRRVRRDTVEGLFGTLRRLDQTFAAVFSGQARFSVSLARSRGYDTALEAYLDRDEVSPAIYRNLVSAVEANLEPLHRYMRFRREQAHVEELHIYDLYTPIVPDVAREWSYEEASRVVKESLAPLGEEYGRVLTEGLRPGSGWIDLYPHTNKDSGAFSASVYGAHPFVFMSYFGELDDLMTLAHEFGHAAHSHYTMQHQPYVMPNYVPVIAETASTFNEVLVLRHLIAQAGSDDERLFLLGKLVESIRTTVYRQTLFASFEFAVHTAVERGEPTTAEALDRIYADLLRRYYGDALTLGPNDGMEWAYIPHFYYKYYVYAYAMGLCSGIALGDRVLAGGAAERDAYLAMLSAGGSRPPLDLLRAAGVDASDPAVVAAAARLLDQSLAQMEEILARRASDGEGG